MRNTKPDSPKAIEKFNTSALTAAEGAIGQALQILADALSNSPDTATVIQVQQAIKSWNKRIEDTEKVSKAILIQALRDSGTKVTDKGSLSLTVGEFRVEARPTRTGLDPKKVEALLRAKDLSLDELMDKEVKYILNETRLATAVEQELLTQEELETCRYELSYALQPIQKVSN